MIEYIIARNHSDYDAAGMLFREYSIDIKIDLSFQSFDEELDGLRNMYGQPGGGIILCRSDSSFIGCVAIRKLDNEICELKRMYVRPGFRHSGIGRNLLEEAVNLAKQLKYGKIRLDTLNTMKSAIRLYEEFGFLRIQPYYFNPNETALFFEKLI